MEAQTQIAFDVILRSAENAHDLPGVAQGLTLAKPEMVPFRLTQNVIDAFGVSGYEGVFRRVSEITLRVLRDHRDALASVLETFVHDPLVDWTAHGHSNIEDGTENPQAKDAMASIQGKSIVNSSAMLCRAKSSGIVWQRQLPLSSGLDARFTYGAFTPMPS